MRMRALLFLLAVTALFMSLPERVYAHSQHHGHQHHAQSAPQSPAIAAELAVSTPAAAAVFSQLLSVADDAAMCPHGNAESDCGFCCACAASAAAVLAPSALQSWQQGARSQQHAFAISFEVREPVLDLSRPPKSFA